MQSFQSEKRILEMPNGRNVAINLNALFLLYCTRSTWLVREHRNNSLPLIAFV